MIGYTDDFGGIVLSNNSILSVENKVEAYKISKQGINSYYKKVKRPICIDSIFRKPQIGDTLLCVACGRYLGCEFGETYVVCGITHDDRISFDSGNPYTYESKYFIVVAGRLSIKGNNNSTITSSGTSEITITDGSVGVLNTAFAIDRQEVLAQDKLITRKKIIKKLSKRNFFESDLIKRKTNNL